MVAQHEDPLRTASSEVDCLAAAAEEFQGRASDDAVRADARKAATEVEFEDWWALQNG